MQCPLLSTAEYLQQLGNKPCLAQTAGQTSQKGQPKRQANSAVHDMVGKILMGDGGAHRQGTHRDEVIGSPNCFLESPL